VHERHLGKSGESFLRVETNRYINYDHLPFFYFSIQNKNHVSQTKNQIPKQGMKSLDEAKNEAKKGPKNRCSRDFSVETTKRQILSQLLEVIEDI